MPFSATQVAAMPTDEKNVRFCAVCADGVSNAAPLAGWDGEIVGDTSYYYRAWLEQLLWPEVYPPGYPNVYCSSLPTATAAAGKLGMDPVSGETAEQFVSRVLYTVGQPEVN